MIMTEYPRLGERVCRATLENGLDVLVVPRPGATKKLAYLVTDMGSIHRRFRLEGKEHTVPAGSAHYLEHKLFDLPDRDVTAQLAQLGASVNAFTSYDMTAYYFSCTEHFRECLDLLLEFVFTPYFTEETVEKERGIISQEIDMNMDAPESVVFEQLMEMMYRGHEIRTPILGTAQTIGQICPESLILCHRAFYGPDNMVLCVVGDVDPAEVADLALSRTGREKRPVAEKLCPAPEEMTCPAAYKTRQMEVAMPTFQLGFKCEPTGKGPEAVRQELAADLAAEALFGESSALYLELYQQGLIDQSFGGGFESVDGCALLTCGGDSMDPAQVRDRILARAEELCREGLPEEELLRMKRSAMGRRIRDLDSFDSTCFRLCAYHLTGFDYFDFPAIYESLKAEDLLAFLGRVVRRERCSLSVIEPLGNKEEKHG